MIVLLSVVPFSGPKRYDYDSSKKQWVSTRDGTELLARLSSEIEQGMNVKLDFRQLE